jgi:Flp pilus assembly pilin Flp
MNFAAISQYLNLRMNRDEKGVTTVEYAVMVIVIGVAILIGGTVLPNAIVATFSSVALLIHP